MPPTIIAQVELVTSPVVGTDQIPGGLLDKSLATSKFTDDHAAENGARFR